MLLAIPMLFAQEGIWLPRYVADRPISLPHLVRLVERVLPVLRWQERMNPSRGAAPGRPQPSVRRVPHRRLERDASRSAALSNVPPALAIAMIAVSYLETSGILLALSALSGVLSLAVTGSTVWVALAAARVAWG